MAAVFSVLNIESLAARQNIIKNFIQININEDITTTSIIIIKLN